MLAHRLVTRGCGPIRAEQEEKNCLLLWNPNSFQKTPTNAISSPRLSPYAFSFLQALLERKMGKGAEKGKGKFTEDEVKAMQDVD